MKTRFKLSFGQILMAGPGKAQRALVIAVQPIPSAPGWLNAILAVEDGSMVTKAINQVDFDLSQHHLVSLVETDDLRAAPVLYGPDGRLTVNRG
jgi:hypothetical protein